MEKVVIIGSGPAGYTAAIYAVRANLDPIIISGMLPGGQLTQTTDVENFPGFEEPIGGFELVETMRKQAERLGVRIIYDEVTGCDLAGKTKKLFTSSSGEIETQTLIIATGASARYLGLNSEQELIGKGVSACATCDGSFFKDQKVAVVGGGDTALEEALYLSRIAAHVTLIHRRDEFRAAKIMGDRVMATNNITVRFDSVVDKVLGVADGTVTGIRLKNVKDNSLDEIDVQGVFIAIGHTPNTAFLKGQVETDAEGYIVADRTRTSIEGVYAAGDVQDKHYRQAITAAGSGCMAALEAERYLTAAG